MRKAFVVLGLMPLFALGVFAENPPQSPEVPILSQQSILHLGSIDSFDITERGKAAARELLEGIETQNAEKIQAARKTYEEIIPLENFGGEYSALAWFCDYLLAPEAERGAFLTNALTRDFLRFFGENDYAVLKEYLNRKYRLERTEDLGTNASNRRLGYLDDFILFNNPRRETWEHTSRIIDALPLQPGQSVADIGCGPGYYTCKFADKVGPEGTVYALDINDLHVAYLSNFVARMGIPNIHILLSNVDDVVMTNSVDMAFLCSLYHVIYTTSSESDKDELITSIKRMLKPDGRLVIVDNGLVDDTTLPYHGPYISKELLAAQMAYYGFALEKSIQIIPQRYMLVFRQAEPPPAGPTVAFVGDRIDRIAVGTKASLVHLPNDDAPSITPGSRKAAKVFHLALETKNREALELVREQFKKIIENEKVGDEHSAFVWFCDYLLADEAGQKAMLAQGYNAEYFGILGGDDFKMLKLYVQEHYGLQSEEIETLRTSGFAQIKKRFFPTDEDAGIASVQPEGQGQRVAEEPPGQGLKSPEGTDAPPVEHKAGPNFVKPTLEDRDQIKKPTDLTEEQVVFLRDFILFNNPNREQWEKSSMMLAALDLKAGQSVADIGCGPGYFSYMFSEKVGTNGHVYAVDTNRKHLEYIDGLTKNRGIGNIETVESRFDDCCLKADSADVVFLCSLYTVIYSASIEKVKDDFVASLHKALRQDGRLVIVDNAVVEAGTQPYHGPYMARELIIAQMKHYGFDLVQSEQFIPQRYMLIFREADAAEPAEAKAPVATAP